MLLNQVVEYLDEAFYLNDTLEDLVAWSFTKSSKEYLNKDFMDKKTGLILNSSDHIQEVFTCVFVTDNIIDQVLSKENCLLVTHHNFDYYEDGRGLCPIKGHNLARLKEKNISLYVAHAGLDTHEKYGTSKALAELLDLKIESYFFNYFGKPTGLIASLNCDINDLCNTIKNRLVRKNLTLKIHHNHISKIAIIAGGGDEPDILQEAQRLGADTMIGGTIENTWNFPPVQALNKAFHHLNDSLKLNLIGASHYATERPAMINVLKFFNQIGIESSFLEDEDLLNT